MNRSGSSSPSTILSEISGAFGDLGTTLPLAFALAYFCHIPLERLFLLWGLAYLLTASYYRLPISIQPLKAMAVIAISMEISSALISTAAIAYGFLFIVLSLSGLIHWLQRFFPISIIRGIQLGIGLLLALKAIELLSQPQLLLGVPSASPWTNAVIATLTGILLWIIQFRHSIPIAPLLILSGIIGVWLLGLHPDLPSTAEPSLIQWHWPQWSLLIDALWLLIIPQLPLTIGNAVFAAADTCCTFWPHAGHRASPRRLALSIGVLNVGIGFAGGFPICHGAGGIAAHAQFGARTGLATAIIGIVLLFTALIPPLQPLLFAVPIPILAVLLLFDAGRMLWFFSLLHHRHDQIIALVVALLAVILRNLTVAVLIGLVVRLLLQQIAQDRGNHARR